MSNFVDVKLRQEREININFEPVSKEVINVYLSCDGVRSWVGTAYNKEELMDIVGPENIIESIEESLSEDEAEIIMAALICCDYEYYIGDEIFIAEK